MIVCQKKKYDLNRAKTAEMRTTQTYHTSLWFWLAKSCRLSNRLDIHADRKYSANFNSFRGKQKKLKKDATGEIGSLATKNLAPCVVVGQN